MRNFIFGTAHISDWMYKIELSVTCSHNGRRWERFRNLMGKSIGKRSIVGPKRLWEDNIRLNIKKIGDNMNNWHSKVQDRVY